MKFNKSLAVAGVATTIGLASVLGVGLAAASTIPSGKDNIVDKIAQKFNLNRDEVKAVFDEEKAVHESEREQKMSEHLQELVDDGKITAEQKTKIEVKLEELKDKRETAHDELEAWAKENNIDMKYLRPMHGPGHMGFKGPGGRL